MIDKLKDKYVRSERKSDKNDSTEDVENRCWLRGT